MEVSASGLVAAAEKLAVAAEQLALPAVVVHPPLAADQTSVAAAARLTAAAESLQNDTAVQAAALTATAEHLSAIAARFTEQEAINSATIQTVPTVTAAAGPTGSPAPLPPVPSVAADLRTPLPPPAGVDAETVAQQLWAGSASAGIDFAQSWHNRATVAASVRDVIRDAMAVIPEVWNSPAGTVATTTRLQQHDDAVAEIANRGAALADQAGRHTRSYRGAVAKTPQPAEFAAVKARLRQAVEANTGFPGRYTPLVSSLIAQQGALRQQAVNTQTQYREETETATRPEESGALAAQLPAMLGAVGGMLGGAVAAATQLPQQLIQTAAQGLSGLATSAAGGIGSATTGFDTPARHPVSVSDGQAGTGATAPAGGTDMPPVSPATSSAPPPTTSLPQGSVPTSTAAAGGPALMPMGMPMGMVGSPAAADGGQQAAGTKKIVVPVVPHTESVTGRTAPERLATGADSRPTRRRVMVRTFEDDGS